MASKAHAVLSASSAHRWLFCTPSARLEQEFGDTSSEAAAEGTAAHALAEHKLKRALKRRSRRPSSDYDSDEMEEHTDSYVAFVLEHLTDEELKDAVSEIRRVLREGSGVMVRCFAKGDMRETKGTAAGDSAVIRGNGILYRYFDEDELCQIFEGFECVRIRMAEDRTRFGTVRRRIEAFFLR